ncbi:Zinc finger protein 84 [Plakobranchus ocellatus]|uniref:Zinc finger protein 84 n=1 Tax=Plakobranchus ocellatus TaxID=259542 RepID=A0AAV4A6D4_9GAST|nr:Zinc finger protein 84 [Plakobranchus ocellatus]
MEFALTLSAAQIKGTPDHIDTLWHSLNAGLSKYLKDDANADQGAQNVSFLSLLGGKQVINKVLSSGAVHFGDDLKIHEILQNVAQECLPKFLLLYERHKMFTCTQSNDECPCHFLSRLRNQWSLCALGEQSEAFFKVRMVEGLLSPQLQQHLCTMDQQHLSGFINGYLHLTKCDVEPCNISLLQNFNEEKAALIPLDLQQNEQNVLAPGVTSKHSKQSLELKENIADTRKLTHVGSGWHLEDYLSEKQTMNRTVEKQARGQNKIYFTNETEVCEDNHEKSYSNPGVHINQQSNGSIKNQLYVSNKRTTRSSLTQNKKISSAGGTVKKPTRGKSKKTDLSTVKSKKTSELSRNSSKLGSNMKCANPSNRECKRQPISKGGQSNMCYVITRSKKLIDDTKKNILKDSEPLQNSLKSGTNKKERHVNAANVKSQKIKQQISNNLSKYSSRRTKPGPKPKPPPKEEGILPCDSCHRYFKREWFLQCHKILRHSTRDTVQCTLCSEGPFASNSELLNHVRFQHRNGQFRYACPICKKSFRVRAQLREHHKVEHLGRVEFSCDTCPKKFKSAKVFHRHSALCKINSEISYPCPTCGLSFSTKQKLERHERGSHTGEKPFQCTECSCRFAMKCDLAAHMKVHDQKRSRLFQCHVCGKTFFERYYLPRHMLQHQGIKNFSCQHCGDLFTTNYGLKKHCWRKHGQLRPQTKNLKGKDDGEKYINSQACKIKIHSPLSPSSFNVSNSQPVVQNVTDSDRCSEKPTSEELHSVQKMLISDSSGDQMCYLQIGQDQQNISPFWHEKSQPVSKENTLKESFLSHDIPCTSLSSPLSAAMMIFQSSNTGQPDSLPQHPVNNTYQGLGEPSVTPLLRLQVPDAYQMQMAEQLTGPHAAGSSIGIQLTQESNLLNHQLDLHQSVNAREVHADDDTLANMCTPQSAYLKQGISNLLQNKGTETQADQQIHSYFHSLPISHTVQPHPVSNVTLPVDANGTEQVTVAQIVDSAQPQAQGAIAHSYTEGQDLKNIANYYYSHHV